MWFWRLGGGGVNGLPDENIIFRVISIQNTYADLFRKKKKLCFKHLPNSFCI